MCKMNELDVKEYTNYQSGEVLDLERVSQLSYNSLLKVKPELWIEWDFKKNNELRLDIWKVTKGSAKMAWWIGSCKHGWDMKIIDRKNGQKCPYCSNHRVLVGYNDIWTTNPELAKLLADPSDGYKYTQSTNVKLNWKCQNCSEFINNKPANDIKAQGLPCPNCSNGKSFPERIMRSLLTTLNVEYQNEIAFNWSDSKRYDFYIPSLSMIIEMHGEQHYKESFIGFSNTCSLDKVQFNDNYKYTMAIKNNIKEYIVIDCRYSRFDFIKNKIINSHMNTFFDFSKINWTHVYKSSNKNIYTEILSLWNNGLNRDEISENLKIRKVLVSKYIREFIKLGLCTEDDIRLKPNKYKKVYQVSVDGDIVRIWDCVSQASEELNLNKRKIQECCRGEIESYYNFKWHYERR